VLDTSVLIEAQRQGYYALDRCPGFWDCLAWQLHEGRCRIISEVRKELTKDDEIARWVDATVDGSLIDLAKADGAVVNCYREVTEWVVNRWPDQRRALLESRNSDMTPENFRRRTEPEVARFLAAKCADPWVIAYAKANHLTIVTMETTASQKRWYVVKIPDVCSGMSVNHCTVPQMLETLGVSFSWNPGGGGSYPQSTFPMSV
jgi:hypothetical protein